MTTCPVCGAVIGAAERVDGIDPVSPAPGAVLVCPGCVMPLVVDELGGLRLPTPLEHDEAVSDPAVVAVMASLWARAAGMAAEYRRRRAPWLPVEGEGR